MEEYENKEIKIYRDVKIAQHRCETLGADQTASNLVLEVACFKNTGKGGGFGIVKSGRMNASLKLGDNRTAIVKFPSNCEPESRILRPGS